MTRYSSLRMLWTFVLYLAVTSANVLPRQTRFANISASSTSLTSSTTSSIVLVTSPSATITPPATLSNSTTVQACSGVQGVCYECGGLVGNVGLNSWWTSSYNLTVATVVVNYLQYNNTLIAANSSTILVPNATDIYGTYTPLNVVPTFSGVPTTLLDGFTGTIYDTDYAATAIGSGVVVSAGGQTFQSPTAYTQGFQNILVGWTKYSDGVSVSDGATYANSVFTGGSNPLTSAFPASQASPTYSGSVVTDIPSAWLAAITSGLGSLYIDGTTIPASSCSGSWQMSGEPTVHIPVNALTATNANTQTINGNFGSTTSSKPTVALSPVIQSSQTSLDQPTVQTTPTTAAPIVQPSQTSLDQPSESSPTNAPPLQQTSANSPPQNSPAPNNGGENSAQPAQASPSDVPQGQQASTSLQPIAATGPNQGIGSSPSQGASGGLGNSGGGQTGNPGNGGVAQPSAQSDKLPPQSNGGSNSAPSANDQPGAVSPASPKAPIVTIGTSAFTQNSQSNFIIGSQTLAPGAAPITVGTNVVSLAPSASAVVVDGQSSQLEQVAASPGSSGQGTDPLVGFILSAIGGGDGGSGGTSGPAPASPAVISVGGSEFTQDSQSNSIVDSQTLVPGGAPITAGGTVLSLAPSASAVVVNGQVSALTPSNNKGGSPAVITIGLSTLTQDKASYFVLGSQTLTPGGSAITVRGSVVSIAPSATAVVINGHTTPAAGGTAAATPAPVITVGQATVTENSAGAFAIGSQTLLPGGPAITVGSQTLSLAQSATAVVINGQTMAIATPGADVAAPVITVGGSIYTENSASAFVVGSQTLLPGGPAITIGTQTLSLAPSATAVVVNGQTVNLMSPTANAGAPMITVAGSVYTENSASAFVIGSQTLLPGGPAITIGTNTISFGSSASAVVINGQTMSIGSPALTEKPEPVITLGNSVFTENSASEFVIGAQTLSAGGSAITIDGTTLSLAPGGSTVILNGQTSSLETQTKAPGPAPTSSGAAAPMRAASDSAGGWTLLVGCLLYFI